MLSLKGKVVSAPLANISGSAYRTIARKYGATMVYSEMISVDGLVRANRKTLAMLKMRQMERPLAVQLFGHKPKLMAEAAKIVADCGADMIDINLGCPAKKVVKNDSGAALVKNLKLAEDVISAVVQATDLPVSVKFRLGWDHDNHNFLEVGKIAESSGAVCVTLHPRTRSDGFKGHSDWSKIAELKQSIDISVIGSGDISTPTDASRMIEQTGCDLVMIGRAAMGAPWIFKRVNQYLEQGYDPGEPELPDRIDIMLEFARLMIEDFGERSACLKMRKHLAWYTRGWKHASSYRPLMFAVETYDDIVNLFERYLENIDKVA